MESTEKIAPEFSRHLDEALAPRTGRDITRLTDNFAVIGVVFQQPAAHFQEVRQGINLSQKIWALFTTSIIFLAIYGSVLGSGHPLLSLNAAIAVPFLILGSLITCMPVMYLLDVLTGSQRSLSQMVTVLLTSMGAAATVFFSFAPIMVVFRLSGSLVQYFWLNLGVLAIATLVGLIYVTQGLIQTALTDNNHHLSGVNKRLHFLWMLLYLMVISQMAWGMISFFEQAGGFSGFLVN